MKLFKKQTTEIYSNDAIAEKIAKEIVEKQHRFADYLNSRSRTLSSKSLAYILFGLCIAFAGYCTYLLLTAIN